VSRGVHPALTQDTPPPICGQWACKHYPHHLVQAHAMRG